MEFAKNKRILLAVSIAGIFILALAAVFIASSNPIVADWITSSDQLTIPAMVAELHARPYEFAGWQLSRSTYLFPDTLSYVISQFIIGNSLLAIPLAALPVLLTWLYLIWKSIHENDSIKPLQALLWTISVGLIIPFALAQSSPDLTQWVLKYYFSFANHFSCLVISIVLLHWSVLSIGNNSRKRLIAISAILVLMSISNRAVWAYYVAPFCVMLLLFLARGSRINWKQVFLLGGVITSALVIGYLGEASFNRITAMPYEISLASIYRRVPLLFSDIYQYAVAKPAIGLFLLCVLFVYSMVLRKLWVDFPRWSRNQLSVLEDTRFLFDFALVVGGLGNVLAAGIAWEELASARYLMFFFFAPMLLIPRVWISLVGMRTQMVSLAFLVTFSAYSVFASDAALDIRVYARKETKDMVACVNSLAGNRGIGGFWIARRLSFLSGGDLRIDQLTPWKTDSRHLLFYWGNNAFSFLRGHPSIDPYDYIIADGLDRAVLDDAFGLPDEKRICGGHEIWSFRDPSHIFPRLFQGNMEPYQRVLMRNSFVTIPAGAFVAAIGSRDGLGRKADLALDSPGFLVYGGYLSLQPGNYRFTVNYSSSGDFMTNRKTLGRFEIVNDLGKAVLGHVEMALEPNQSRATATVNIHLRERANFVEPRVMYYGENLLQVSELSVATGESMSRTIRLRADDTRMHTLVGRKEDRIISSIGKTGVLLYGPYIPMPAGSYRATVHFLGALPIEPIGTVDIAAESGKVVFSQKNIAKPSIKSESGGYKIDVDFELPHPAIDLELRLISKTTDLVKISHYEIFPRP